MVDSEYYRSLKKKHVRQSNYKPLVKEVQLLHVNPEYVTVRLLSGKKSTVSLKYLATIGIVERQTEGQSTVSFKPLASRRIVEEQTEELARLPECVELLPHETKNVDDNSDEIANKENNKTPAPTSKTETSTIVRSTRKRLPPSYLSDIVK